MIRLIRILFVFLLSAGAAWAQLSNTITIQRNFPVPPNAGTFTLVNADCPDGWSVLSGGLDSLGSPDIELSVHGPTFAGDRLINQSPVAGGPASGWMASVINYGTSSWTVMVTAVCAQIPGVHVVIASNGVTAASNIAIGTGSVEAPCAAGEVATGGGVDVTNPDVMAITSSSPYFPTGNPLLLADRPAGNSEAPTGWQGFVVNQVAMLGGVVKVAAICVAPDQLNNKVITVVSGPVPVPQAKNAGNVVVCPAGYIALGGGFDSKFVTLLVGTVSTPFYPGYGYALDRPSGQYSAPAGWFAGTYSHSPTADARSMVIGVICAQAAAVDPASVVSVFEFYNTNLKHYFRTASATEAASVDIGSAGPGWVRTGDNFTAYAAGSALPGSDVCRFYTFGANSHFYTAFADECASLKSPTSGWVYEGLSFRIPLPASDGTCPTGTVPVHRLYNNRFAFNDSNHRFTTVTPEIATLQAQGWQYEGVAFCSPNFSAG